MWFRCVMRIDIDHESIVSARRRYPWRLGMSWPGATHAAIVAMSPVLPHSCSSYAPHWHSSVLDCKPISLAAQPRLLSHASRQAGTCFCVTNTDWHSPVSTQVSECIKDERRLGHYLLTFLDLVVITRLLLVIVVGRKRHEPKVQETQASPLDLNHELHAQNPLCITSQADFA